jgi:hypothetical protein
VSASDNSASIGIRDGWTLDPRSAGGSMLLSGPQGDHCVVANGHMDPDGKGMKTFSDYMCAFDPGTYGMYIVTLNHMLVSNALAKQKDNTLKAILANWKVNQQVINQQTAAASQQAAANTQALIRRNEQWVDHIHQIGADATVRMNAAQKAHDIQNQSFEQREDAISRNGQGFTNHLLDQTVVQDNNMYNNSTIGHGTAWNSTADALVKADPNRFEIVDTPNYWRGIDY